MSIFFNKKPIAVNTQLALLIGFTESLVLQQIHYWVNINKKSNKNFKNGYYWTYNTFEEWHKNNFPFLSVSTITRTIGKLEKAGLLKTAVLNKKGYDRTKWYRVDYEEVNKIKLSLFNTNNTENGDIQEQDYMNIFYNNDPLIINVELAEKIGLNESIVLQQVHYWLEINKSISNNFKNDNYWTYNTFKNWQENNFPFWSLRTVKKVINKLEKDGLLISDNLNKNTFDRTKWYRINYCKVDSIIANIHNAEIEKPVNIHSAEIENSVDIHSAEIRKSVNTHSATENIDEKPFCQNCTIQDAGIEKSFCHSCTMQGAELIRPIPETITETNNRDLTTTTNTAPLVVKEVKEEVVVVNTQADINFINQIEIIENILKQNGINLTQETIGKLLSAKSDTTYNNELNNKKIISDKLIQHNIKFSTEQIDVLMQLANNNTDIIIKYINYMIDSNNKINNPFGYLKSLILNKANIKENNKVNNEQEPKDENLEEKIEIVIKKLNENNISLEDDQIKSLLKLANNDVQILISYIDYMLNKQINIQSVYAYLRCAIINNWDVRLSNYEGKEKNTNPNKIANFTGRTWDFAKIKELEQQYLEDSVKDL